MRLAVTLPTPFNCSSCFAVALLMSIFPADDEGSMTLVPDNETVT